MAARNDFNKDTIMKMLRTDVFGFKASDIEEKAKEVYNVVSDNLQKKVANVKGKVGDYVRNDGGFIVLKLITKAKKSKSSKL